MSKRMTSVSQLVSCPQNFTVVTLWQWTWFTFSVKESWTLTAAYPGSYYSQRSMQYSCVKMAFWMAWLYVHSVSPRRRREVTCWSPVLHRPHRLSSLPFWQLSNQQYVMMQRRPGEVTSTSLYLTQMAPAQSTLFMCFPRYFRYYHIAS